MQTRQNMDALIAHELEEGERVLWTGRPDPNSKSSASPMLPFYIMTGVFGLVGILLILIGFIVSISVHGKSGSDAFAWTEYTRCCIYFYGTYLWDYLACLSSKSKGDGLCYHRATHHQR